MIKFLLDLLELLASLGIDWAVLATWSTVYKVAMAVTVALSALRMLANSFDVTVKITMKKAKLSFGMSIIRNRKES